MVRLYETTRRKCGFKSGRTRVEALKNRLRGKRVNAADQQPKKCSKVKDDPQKNQAWRRRQIRGSLFSPLPGHCACDVLLTLGAGAVCPKVFARSVLNLAMAALSAFPAINDLVPGVSQLIFLALSLTCPV